jgi:anti-sigma-K factor RskA
MNETQLIDDYLFKRLSVEDRLVLEARLLSDLSFKTKLEWQCRVYEIAKAYGRATLKREIMAVERQLFSEPQFKHFRNIISNIFR